MALDRPEWIKQLLVALIIFVLGGLLAFGSQYVGNLISAGQTSSAILVRLGALEEFRAEQAKANVTREELNRLDARITDTQKSYVTKDQFAEAISSVLRGLGEVRDELREARTAKRS